MLDRLSGLVDRRAKVVVAITAVFFLVAAYFGGNVAEYMGPYGDADPATESIRADELLQDAGYREVSGQVLVDAPTDADSYIGLQPVYEEMPGWSESTLGAKTLDDLPAAARAYIKRVEELVGAPIDIISTGPDRNETIVLRDPFTG